MDRHAGPLADKLALRCLPASGEPTDLTYADLRSLTNRFANLLGDLGIGKGERVFALAPRIPGLHVAVLGALKKGCVLSPLFPAFGPGPIETRMKLGDARVLVTTASLYERKIAGLRAALPGLEHVLLVDRNPKHFDDPSVRALWPLLDAAAAEFEIAPTDPEDPALLHFTSGTTGRPKGALHVHAAVIAHHVTGRYALDLHADDVYWCTADPERWYGILQDHRFTVWYTAPTAIRMLMKAGADLARGFRLDALRFAASVGEPLNPEAVLRGTETLGVPFHDNWWQTETGGIMIANFASMDIKPGSMGKPLPGVEAAIVRRISTSRPGMHSRPCADSCRITSVSAAAR